MFDDEVLALISAKFEFVLGREPLVILHFTAGDLIGRPGDNSLDDIFLPFDEGGAGFNGGNNGAQLIFAGLEEIGECPRQRAIGTFD